MNKSGKKSGADYGAAIYEEKIHASFAVLAFLFFLMASLALAFWAALGSATGLISMAILIFVIVWFRQATALSIRVTKGWLIVGPAAIERAFLASFAPLSASEMRRIRGVDADPAAFLQIRFWVKSGLKIALRDPKDPTPYWLVSSHRVAELVKALDPHQH